MQFIEQVAGKQRKTKYNLRTIPDSIFWTDHTDTPWQELAKPFPIDFAPKANRENLKLPGSAGTFIRGPLGQALFVVYL
jgi:hypothetical protein